jgi:hypothetical protein
MYANIQGMSSSQYLLLYYDSYDPSVPTNVTGSGPLNVLVATISGDLTVEGTAEITFSTVATLSKSALSFYFAVTKLDNDTAVIAYIDSNNNFGISVQIVQMTTNLDKQSIGNLVVIY